MRRDENGIAIPETALPWCKDEHRGINGADSDWVTVPSGFLYSDDHDYAIHAANHHGSLVSALSDLASIAEIEPNADDPDHDLYWSVRKANELLNKMLEGWKGEADE